MCVHVYLNITYVRVLPAIKDLSLNKNNFCTFALNSFFTVRSVAWLNIILFPYRPEVSGFHIGVVVDCVTMQLHHHSLVQFLAV